ncbi:MAG TPA: hypothetical protein VHP54_03595 [Caproiciproducens sp.]|nr:hypothetical protein [Caproiciproducens sp.]
MKVAVSRPGGAKKKRKKPDTFWLLVFMAAALCCILFIQRNSEKADNRELTRNLEPHSGVKTNIGLANFAWNALDCRSAYVFGAVGQRVTPEFLRRQASWFAGNQRAELSGSELGWIYARYGGRPAFDCIGLIKAYSWIDEKTGEISSKHKNAMPDCTVNGLLAQASEYGPIAAMPDIPGLAVQMDGHIGVYVGSGEVIEAQGNRSGVKKTKLNGRGWKWYVKVPGIHYEENGTYLIHGRQVTLTQGKICQPEVIPGISGQKPQ